MILSRFDPLPSGNIILSDHAAHFGLLRRKKMIRVPFVPFTFIMTTPDGAWTYGSLFGRRWGPGLRARTN